MVNESVRCDWMHGVFAHGNRHHSESIIEVLCVKANLEKLVNSCFYSPGHIVYGAPVDFSFWDCK